MPCVCECGAAEPLRVSVDSDEAVVSMPVVGGVARVATGDIEVEQPLLSSTIGDTRPGSRLVLRSSAPRGRSDEEGGGRMGRSRRCLRSICNFIASRIFSTSKRESPSIRVASVAPTPFSLVLGFTSSSRDADGGWDAGRLVGVCDGSPNSDLGDFLGDLREEATLVSK